MSMGMMAANEAFRQQKRAFDAKQARREARADAMREARRGAASTLPADEEMACPRCEERYLFGNVCPDCSVDLVSESHLPHVGHQQPRVRMTVRGLLVALLGLAGGIAWLSAVLAG